MNEAALAKALEDVAAVIVTPMHADLSIDEAGLRRHARAMADAGVRVIVPAGNTGEFYALTREENERVIRIACEEVAGRALVLAGVGYSVPDSIALARVAEKAGAKAVMIHQPICPYVHPDGLARYVRTIADAIGIGVVLYVKDPNVTPAMLAPALEHPRVVGVKYAVNDLQKVGVFTAAFPAEKYGVAWLCGTAEAWAPFFWTAGCRGFTSGLVNVAPRLALDMLEALRAGDAARAQSLWRLLKPIEDLRAKHATGNNVAVVKAAMALAGVNVGGVRPPSAPMREEDRPALAGILESWGVLRRQAAE
jgi:4-hydroxy-tetrahydrodipicolinate synthase